MCWWDFDLFVYDVLESRKLRNLMNRRKKPKKSLLKDKYDKKKFSSYFYKMNQYLGLILIIK